MAHKILTVDDSRTIRTIIKNAFKPYHCDLYEAENGRDGLALASKVRPDLIILDITMPVMTGIEMLSHLMADDALKQTAVIMLTAESGRDNVMNIVKMGVKDYMVKPFKGEQLIERVRLIIKDLQPRMDASAIATAVSPEQTGGHCFSVDGNIAILTFPEKITRNLAVEIIDLLKTKIRQMNAAGARQCIIDVSPVNHLNMTAVQTILALANVVQRAKLSVRFVANQSQGDALKGFKETSGMMVLPSLAEAKADF